MARIRSDFDSLTREQQKLFLLAIARFVEDLERQRGFRKGIRVKGIRGTSEILEMTWADDGRATFEYGKPVLPGEPHVIWRRVGTYQIFETP